MASRLSWWIFAAVLFTGGCGYLDNREEGQRAYDKGNYAHAARIWAVAARNGNASAQYSLGYLYETGTGKRQDYGAAARYYSSAARQQHPYAQAALAILYAYGRGVPHDYARSYRWSSLAAANYPKWARDERAAALRNRDIVAARMSVSELLAALRSVEQPDNEGQ